MNPFVTVAVFDLPHNAYIIRSKLESLGIEVMLKDELTIQVDNFLSNALGGVKLQIREADLERARPILLEAGLLKETPATTETAKSWFERQTDRIPLISRWPTSLRAISIVGLTLILATVIGVALVPPPTEEQLASRKEYERRQAQQKLDWVYIPRADSLVTANPTLAVAYIKEVSKEYPKNPVLTENLGMAYYELGLMEDAIKQFELSMEYGEHEHARGLANIAVCKIQLKDLNSAIVHLIRASELNWKYNYDLADAYERNEDLVNAAKHYTVYLDKLQSQKPLIIGDEAYQKLRAKVAAMRTQNNSRE
ncbi:MAG: DUF2007 domain-containing protein [Roseivirga sp.]|nr:DUF2007 domain-containing protein [Roseivirga sp.]